MKPEKQLYQWDVNQYLTGINPAAQYVDYTIGNEVIRLETDGTRCRIPDELLQTDDEKTCYERYHDGTFRSYSFTVLYAPKPPGYAFTKEERTTFEALTARADAAISEIKRRADSGEFTPKKGVDYFTNAEKAEMMENVSSGAVGEFREVVDSATADFNKNSSVKTNDYNTNAETKTAEFDSNAAEKLKAYNDNHTEKMTAYDTNATDKLSTYNRNATEKLEAYNSNHTAKVAEYNANAETKTAEFDSNAAALQTEVDRLRGECDNLAAENRKQENRISALMKLNKGQTYDILPEEGETASRTAPSGAKYVSVDKVGGKSVVWNQQVDTTKAELRTYAGVTLSINENGKLFLSGTAIGGTSWTIIGEASLVVGHKYISESLGENIPVRIENMAGMPNMQYNGDLEVKILTEEAKSYVYAPIREGETVNAEIDPFLIDLTIMFGAGNEPTAEQFEAMFPAESYPYNPGEIISSRTETITAGAETITTGFPELRSAGTAHDEIDMDGGQVIRNVYTVEIETLQWRKNADNRFVANLPAKAKAAGTFNDKKNELCNTYESKTMNELFAGEKGIATHPITGETVWIFDIAYETPEQLVTSLSGAVLHYEMATPTTEQVTIPEALQEWLPVEPGGTVAFRNSDESKQLAVPNAVSWVRKLDEVN